MPPVTYSAPAKINLFLNIMGPGPNGYHKLRMVMQTLDLSDTLHIRPGQSAEPIVFSCSDPALAGEDNLVVRAYHAFYAETGLNPLAVEVYLEKAIPVAAGLGGGSSDAAAILMALNALHDEKVPLKTLHTVAQGLGSDVPFFLYGGTAIVTGTGDEVMPALPLPQRELVLVKPRQYGISAAAAYAVVKARGVYQEVDFSAWQSILMTGKKPFDPTLLHNDFEAALFPDYPDLAAARQTLLDAGCEATLLSGSGPTLFGLLPPKVGPIKAKLATQFTPSEWQVIYTKFSSD